jgi:hypothetical protein
MPAVISLSSVPAAGLAASKLIAPVKVGGNLYYFWDLSGNGSSAANDNLVNHNTLDTIFNQSSTGSTLVGDTTDTQRYTTIDGLRLAVTTLTNLSSIRTGGGLPAGWFNGDYWAATVASPDNHQFENISSGAIFSDYDNTQDATWGSYANYYVALQVVGIAGPAVPTLALATDSGSSSSDGITNVATVNLSNLVANTTWQYQIDGGTWTTGTGASFNLLSGTHTYAAHQTDQSGNVGFDTATFTYTLDTTAPSVTIADTTAGVVNSGYAHFTFTFSETVAGFISSDITASVGALGTLTGSGASYAMDITPPMGSGNMVVGITTGSFTDVAGNVNSVATALDVQSYNMLSQAGQAVVNLAGSGKLIAPIEVEGKWYYFWDRNGDGTTSASDLTTHDVLDAIFNHDINGVTNTTVANADGLFGTTDVYRYGTLNGVQLALPTLGANYPGNQWMPGTSASGAGTATNATYNDLLAVWDALNGTGTGSNIAGTPTGWQASSYLTSTPSGTGHVYISTLNGLVNVSLDNGNNGSSFVALQIL